MEEPFTYKPGMFFIGTAGKYEDYAIGGLFRVLKSFTFAEIREAYLTLHPQQREPYDFEDDMFFKFLARHGYAVRHDYREMHVSCYGTVHTTDDSEEDNA